MPLAYNKVNAIFVTPEKKSPGRGGIFSIFVSDLCKGCAECVTECGDHQALVMAPETEDVNSHHLTGTAFMNLLPGHLAQVSRAVRQRRAPARLEDGRPAQPPHGRKNYDALVSGDGACADCGEKSVLHSVASVTEP